MTIEKNRIYTVPQVAEILQVSRAFAYGMVSRNEIPHIKLGKSVRVRGAELLDWIDSKVAETHKQS